MHQRGRGVGRQGDNQPSCHQAHALPPAAAHPCARTSVAVAPADSSGAARPRTIRDWKMPARGHSVANHAGNEVDACKPGVERAAEQRSALPAGGPGALATDKQMPPLSSCDLLQLLGLPPGYMCSAARRSAPSMWRV